MKHRLCAAWLVLGLGGFVLPAAAGELTRESIVRGLAAVEGVRHGHRSWPESNPGSRPPLAERLDSATIELRVRDLARRSEALRRYWNAEISPRALQAELDRMARETQDPVRLRELFDALGGDARLAAEVLARPALVERHLRARYARDVRLHASTRRIARSRLELRRRGEIDGARLQRLTVLRSGPAAGDNAITLDPPEFEALVARVPSVGEPPILDETDTAFVIARTLEQTEDGIVLEQEAIPKQSLESWWAEESAAFAGVADVQIERDFEFELPSIAAQPSTLCNAWDDPLKIDRLPRARYGHTAVWTGSEMLVWGGSDTSGYTGPLLRYDPATDSWATSTATVNLPPARAQHTAVWTGSEMLVWGGHNPSLPGGYLADGGRYDPATDSWQPISGASPAPWPRVGHTAVWTGSAMVIWGGAHWNGDVADGGLYDPATDTWSATALGNAPQPRRAHTAVWTGNEMIVWGGVNGSSYLNSLGRYQPTTDTWTSSAYINAPPSARAAHSAVWTGSQVLVWGGSNAAGPVSGGGRFDVATATWSAMDFDGMPTPRDAHVAVWIDSIGRLVVFGGVNGTALADGGLYDPATDDWQPVRLEGAPSARQFAAAVWTGTELLVWGGVSGSLLRNSGARYDPQLDLWTPMAPNVPIGVHRHTAVWTGSEMIVWGGATPNATQAGAVYDPATASWSALAVDASTPAPRFEHSAVWTGTEMIVWGGTDTSSNYPAVGGAYDPAAGTWRAIDAGTEMPVPRAAATAVWTGTRAIFWGGALYTYTGQNSGGIYDPLADSWISTSTGASTPSARYDHTAVWTGTEMMIWGGCCNEPGATGGAFDPSSNSWRAISTAGAPSGRRRHAAIWDGDRMIVAGGWSGYNTTMGALSGGRYEPITDSWSPIASPTMSQDLREVALSTALWTGREMLMWGGEYMSCGTWSCPWVIHNGGGRYDPANDVWTAIPRPSFAPAARRNHSAVWTGSTMIIWGGTGSTVSHLDTGGLWSAALPASPGTSLRLGKSATADLNWQPCGGSSGYVIKHCNAAAGACVPAIVSAFSAEPSFSDELAGESRFYSIEAINDCGSAP